MNTNLVSLSTLLLVCTSVACASSGDTATEQLGSELNGAEAIVEQVKAGTWLDLSFGAQKREGKMLRYLNLAVSGVVADDPARPAPAVVSLSIHSFDPLKGGPPAVNLIADKSATLTKDALGWTILTSAGETITVRGDTFAYSGESRIPAGFPKPADAQVFRSSTAPPFAYAPVGVSFDALAVASETFTHGGYPDTIEKEVSDGTFGVKCVKNNGCKAFFHDGTLTGWSARSITLQASTSGKTAELLFGALPVVNASVHGADMPDGSTLACSKTRCVARLVEQLSW
jgi:hypothetical protein